ncbi:zinc ABC transporter ATP-binding protein ZnuC, partial [Acinetobacter nosocomialis]
LPLRVKDLLNLEKCEKTIKAEIIRDTGIAKLKDSKVQQLSGGERQRVLLARALLRQPDVLVLDEPMQGLDIQSEAELYDYVRSLPERYGCSILIVSHDLQWVMQGTQRV